MSLINTLLHKATLTLSPIAGTFELTARCNLSCRMCYIHNAACDGSLQESELTATQWIELADQAAASGTLILLLTGGEPMLRPDFPQIYRACAERGFLITVNTNGTLLTPELLALFREHPPLRLNVSLYGMSERVYADLCGNGAMFARVTEHLRALHEAGIPLQINFTATRLNQAELPAVKAFADSLGATLHYTAYSFPHVRTATPSADDLPRFSAEEAAEATAQYARLTQPESRLAAYGTELPPRNDDCGESFDGVRCRAGRASYWITYDGDMLPCGMLPTIRHSAVRLGLADAWSKTGEAFSRVKMPSGCVACPDYERCEVCPAICHAENGRFDAVPEYICQKNRLYRLALRQEAEPKEAAT